VLIERDRQFTRTIIHSADDLRRVFQGVGLVAGIYALWGKSQEEIPAGL